MMLPSLLPLLLAAQVTATPVATDTEAVAAGPRPAPAAFHLAAPDSGPARRDTIHARRPVPIEYSDWYARRLTIHRWASYAMLPMFAGQYFAGDQLMKRGSATPRWIIGAHDALATGVTGLFTVNTVTGVWNMWDGRKDPADRKRRIAHSLLMLASDAGFTAVGLLANPAENSGSTRALHKQIAIGSMGVALLGYVIMLPPFRRD